MLNVLINAYAVRPNWGSEPGLGWNWIVNLAQYCNVFVITEGEWEEEINDALNNIPWKSNIHFYYNKTTQKVRNMCWNQGDWRFYKHYRKWQKKTYNIAQEIIASNKIDIIHQLNMIGFREPGSLWKIETIPFIWGPVGGYGWTTLKYLKGQSINTKTKAFVKNILNYLQGRFYPLSNKAMRRADCVLAANSNVYGFIKKHFRDDVILLNETGCYENEISLSKTNEKKNFNLLWVGKFDYRKQLELAIQTIAIIKENYQQIKLTIIGDTNNSAYERAINLVKFLNIQDNIEWLGKVPNIRVHEIMRESDLFLFTSIDEGTPHVVLEAIQNKLPVVCFNTCGQGDVVNNTVGIKIPLSTATDSPYHFAKAILSLIEDRKKLYEMKKNCSNRQNELSWDRKIRTVIDIYKMLIIK